MTARMDPRVARSRTAVLAATLELLTERGILGTTIESVSERSGVAKTTIYRHWDGQAALVLDAFGEVLQPPPEVDTGSLRGDLVAMLGGLTAALTSSAAARLMPALIDAAERDAAFAELHQAEARRRHAVAAGVIRRGVARGELPPGTDVDAVIDLLAGPLFHRRLVSSGAVDAAFAERVVDVVLAGLRARADGVPHSAPAVAPGG